jgi:hypothetical protein
MFSSVGLYFAQAMPGFYLSFSTRLSYACRTLAGYPSFLNLAGIVNTVPHSSRAFRERWAGPLPATATLQTPLSKSFWL